MISIVFKLLQHGLLPVYLSYWPCLPPFTRYVKDSFSKEEALHCLSSSRIERFS